MTGKMAEQMLEAYRISLREDEVKESTIEKYLNDIYRFLDFLQVQSRRTDQQSDEWMSMDQELKKEAVIAYKQELRKRYKPTSINSYLMSLNRYLKWLGLPMLCVKGERIQRRCSLNHVLELSDYEKLLETARSQGKYKYYCIMKTLAATGIRVGELKHITVEALGQKTITIHHKGKVREIYLPDRLIKLLTDYCQEMGIRKGCIFVGRYPCRPLDPTGVWKALKRLSVEADVSLERVYPHSFRHLFAKTYMKKIGNLAELSDLLGHSSIETTRIYTLETTEEKRASLAKMEL